VEDDEPVAVAEGDERPSTSIAGLPVRPSAVTDARTVGRSPLMLRTRPRCRKKSVPSGPVDSIET
jgi:hypothetical protein